MQPFDADLGAVIERLLALGENLPPGNKGGDALKDRVTRLTAGRESLQRALRQIDEALRVEGPEI